MGLPGELPKVPLVIRQFYIFTILLAVALSGCGDPSRPQALVGTWKVDPTQGNIQHQVLLQPPERRKQFQEMITRRMVLILVADGTVSFMGGRGRWAADDKQLSIRTGNPSTGMGAQTGVHDFSYTLEAGGTALRTLRNGVEVVWRKQ